MEYIRNHPLVYKNDNLTTLYNSNWYGLGHYLGDNAQEVYAAIDLKPFKMLLIKAWYSRAQKGPEYEYQRGTDPATGTSYALGLKYMERVEWNRELMGLRIEYQLFNDFFVFAEVEKQDMIKELERYNSSYFQGNLTTYSFGMNVGFY
jgi:hypothetical protein